MNRVRTSSRSLLRKRLRSTMRCPDFPTIIATRECESRESVTRTSRCSVLIRLPAFLTSSISDFRVMRYLRGNPEVLGAGVFTWQLNSQLLSPFFPAAAQNLAAPSGRHSLSEPVRANPTLIPGTIGWLTHFYSKSLKISQTKTASKHNSH